MKEKDSNLFTLDSDILRINRTIFPQTDLEGENMDFSEA